MKLSELQAVAKVSPTGWFLLWTPRGYVVQKGLGTDFRLENALGGVRYLKTLKGIHRVMVEDLGLQEWTMRGRKAGQTDLFLEDVA